MDVVFDHVSLSYDNHSDVLKDIDFKIPSGQLIALLGPSGSGKSTILNLISGLLKTTNGQIIFNQDKVNDKDALERGVGMVFQNYALYPHMSVLENISFPLKMAKVPVDQRKERAVKLAQLVHIEDQLNKKPKDLSGGQQQRVAIARALAKEPSILLLDEPLSNLDAHLRIEMREEIRRIQQETKVTTIFVTHDQSEAMHIADQIMLLNDGVIQQFDSPQNLYSNPSNQFVASFIGEPALNIIPAEKAPKSLLTFFDSTKNNLTNVGIRPEAIYDKKQAKLIPVSAKIEKVLFYGKEQYANIAIEGVPLVASNVTDAKSKNVYIDPNGLFGFDDQGSRIVPKGNKK